MSAPFHGPRRRIAALDALGVATWLFVGPDWSVAWCAVEKHEHAAWLAARRGGPPL